MRLCECLCTTLLCACARLAIMTAVTPANRLQVYLCAHFTTLEWVYLHRLAPSDRVQAFYAVRGCLIEWKVKRCCMIGSGIVQVQ